MKIGLDIRMYGTSHGGIGRYCKELFLRILELDKENTYILFFNAKTITHEDLTRLKNYKNAQLVDLIFKVTK